MKIYENKGTRHYTPIFNDLKPFDVIEVSELLERDKKIDEYEYTFNIVPKKHRQNKQIPEFGKKVIYIEIPYEFINEWLESWTNDVCMSGKQEKPCRCYRCNYNHRHKTWKYVKSKIQNNEKWESGTSFEFPGSYNDYVTYLEKGIARPIYQHNNDWPKMGTHRLALTAITKSYVPVFFPYEDGEKIINGHFPFFKDESYNKLVINKNKVEFYINDNLVGILNKGK